VRCVVVDRTARRAELRDLPPPRETARHEARLRPVAVGICGTDHEILGFTHGAPPAGRDWWILGHEALLEVVEPPRDGAGAAALAAGALAVPMVRRPCRSQACWPCRNGRQDFCESGEFTERGIRGANGFLAEEIVDDERYLVPVPGALRGVAVLTEPLTIAEKALAQAALFQQRLPRSPAAPGPGRRAFVIGAGAIGLLGALALRALGCEVVVYSRGSADGPRARWATALGCRYVSARDADPAALVRLAGEADLVFEATGAAPLAFEVLERALGTNGVFVFTGIPGRRSPVPAPLARLMRDMVLRNQLVLGTVNASRAHYEAAVRDLARFEADFPGMLARLLAKPVPLERWREAVEWSPDEVKHVVEPEAAR
jgi:threonine dehydrogenase-like Zn-dependent dehydrogenase